MYGELAGTEISEARVNELLKGAIDLHCHSGPSVMPRDLDHIEAMRQADEAGFRAVLVKDHYYSATPVTELLNRNFRELKVEMLSGVPTNNTTGGFNPHAVDHGALLGARLVWMPTFAAANHIEAHCGKKAGFPSAKKSFLEPEPLTVFAAPGVLRDDVKQVLDVIAHHDLVLAGGHLHISEIFALFEEARARGVRRYLVNHPAFIVDASLADIADLAAAGVFIEHSLCMYTPVRPPTGHTLFPPDKLRQLIEAGGVDMTILASDLGQVGNAHPVFGFKRVIEQCILFGYSDADIRKMISGNAARLLELEPIHQPEQ